MAQRALNKKSGMASRGVTLCVVLLLTLVALVAVACGVKSGERRSSRPQGITQEFHRSPVTAFEQFRIELSKTDEGCTAEPADINVALANRVRLAIQLPAEIQEGTTKSLEVVGEKIQVAYEISGLEIKASGGAFTTGVKEFNLSLESGARASYDFNPVNAGQFDILCDGEKVGTFTVTG